MKPAIVLSLLFPSITMPGLSQDAAARPASCGTPGTKMKVGTTNVHGEFPSPGSGNALVFFIQTSPQTLLPNCSVINRSAVDGVWMGGNCNKSFFAAEVSAGQHKVCTERQTKLRFRGGQPIAVTTINLEPGKVYFLKAVEDIQAAKDAALNVSLVEEDEGRLLISGLENAHTKP